MSPKEKGISTTYKTRVALEKPCKKRLGILIGQLKDSRVFEVSTSLDSVAINVTRPKKRKRTSKQVR
jgi:hypothetical protein